MRRTSLSLSAVTIATALALTGCGGGSSSDKSSAGKAADRIDTTPAGTKSVSAVTWGLPQGEPTSIDPMYAGGASEGTVVANLCENLLTVKPDFSVTGGLASSVTFKDPKTLVITVRNGVKFWDGSPMTADDVLFSLQRTANPKLGGYYGSAFRSVRSITKTGANQVTISMVAPDSQLRNALAGPAGTVVQAAAVKKAGKKFGVAGGQLMCTGPYSLVSWKSGDSVVTKANSSYWGGAPKVGQITYKFLGDSATLTTALRSGEIDGAYDLPVSTAVALQRGKTGTVYRGNSTSSLSFGPTTSKGPAANPRVREALDLAINKKALIKSLLRGYGTTQKTLVAPLAWSGDPAAATYRKAYDALPADDTQDLTKAKALIKAAGVGNRKLVMAIPAGASTETQAATAVQAAAKAIGVTIELRPLQPTQFATLFYDPAKRQSVDFVLTVGYQEVPGSLYYSTQFALKQGLFNWSGYNKPQVTAALTAAASSDDPQVTATKYVEAQKIFAPDRLQVTLAGVDSLLYLRKGLSGATVSIARSSSPWALRLGGTK